MEHGLLPAALAAYLLITLVVPVLRTRVKHGIWPTVFLRTGDPVQRVMGLALGLIFVGGGLWAALYAALGPESLGIWVTPAWVAWLGWGLVLAGGAVELWAQATMGASFRVGIDDGPTALVVAGPFRVVRNPIFSALLLSVGGFVLLSPSAWTVMGYLASVMLIAVQTRLEERHLTDLHGEQYLAYASRVGRFCPGVGLLKPLQWRP